MLCYIYVSFNLLKVNCRFKRTSKRLIVEVKRQFTFMGFICDKCGGEFKTNYLLKRHLNRKRPCAKELPEVIPDKMCEWCGNSFTHISSKYTHQKNCIVKKNKEKIRKIKEEKNANEKVNKLVEELAMMREENKQYQINQQKMLELLTELKNDKQQVDINYKSKYIQNNVVIINNAISPNTDFISKEMVGDMLDNHKLNAPIFLTAEIYYGDRPENHSLHITNQKTTEGVAYRNGVWVPLKRNDIQAYLLNGLYTSYDKIIQLGRNIDRYSNDVLLSEIERNQHDDKNIANEIRSLILLAVQTAKKNDISLNFIEEDIKRGRAALKMIDGVLDDNATNNKHGKEEV